MNTLYHEEVNGLIRQFYDGELVGKVILTATDIRDLGLRVMIREHHETKAILFATNGMVTVPVKVKDISREDNKMIVFLENINQWKGE